MKTKVLCFAALFFVVFSLAVSAQQFRDRRPPGEQAENIKAAPFREAPLTWISGDASDQPEAETEKEEPLFLSDVYQTNGEAGLLLRKLRDRDWKKREAEIMRIASALPEKDGWERETLEEILGTEPIARIRWKIVRLLIAIGSEDSLPALKRACGDPDLSVRKEALRATKQTEKKILISKLRSARPELRQEGARELGGFRYESKEEIARVLGFLLLTDPEPEVRQEAAKSFAKIKESSTLFVLGRALKDPCSQVREEVKRAIEAVKAAK